MLQTLTITINYSEQNEGYMYDIYDCEPSQMHDGNGSELVDSIDGGLCTGTILEALEMAQAQVKDILIAKHNKKNK